jgi:hypothetical protein
MTAEAAEATTAPHNSMHGVNYFSNASSAQSTADKKCNLINELRSGVLHFNSMSAASHDW